MQRSINVAVVGFGYWGPNIVRNFIQPKKPVLFLFATGNQRL